jgi:ABC-type phosphate/phosphonate transport system substrate-binding protein
MLGYGAAALAAVAAALTLAAVPPPQSAKGEEQGPASIVRIGIVSSLFRDIPEPMARSMLRPMKSLIETQTGLLGDVAPAGDALQLGQQLVDAKLQLGVFHGFEFAWARIKHPKLQPLVIAVNKQRLLHSYLVVRADCSAHCLEELQGKTLALPKFTREHSRLFLERTCLDKGLPTERFFGKVVNPPDVDDALDGIVDGLAQATVVDSVAWENFQQRKPGRYARLKVLQESGAFPAAVVAFCPGGMETAKLQRFHDGMIHASRSEKGQRMLSMCRMTGFEEVPVDYDHMLQTVARAYPPPKEDSK